ncbi:hypothetical protein MMC34_004378, partial [Xylographa carneopallida]|nr:hypothetical protein [Xylographa carneopallida]
ICIAPVRRCGNSQSGPPEHTPILLKTGLNTTNAALLFPGSLNATTVVQLLDLTPRLSVYDPPDNTSETIIVNGQVAFPGLHNAIYITPAGVILTLALLLVDKSFEFAIKAPSLYENLDNTWRTFIPAASGDFHSYYAARAFIA